MSREHDGESAGAEEGVGIVRKGNDVLLSSKDSKGFGRNLSIPVQVLNTPKP